MATAPKYFDTAKIAHMRLTTGDAATDGSGTPTDFTWIGGAPSGDWMPVKIIVSSSSATGVGNLADSILTIYADDGTTIRKIRTVDLGDAAVGTTAITEFQIEVNFGVEFCLPAAINLAATLSVTPTAGNLDLVLLAQAA